MKIAFFDIDGTLANGLEVPQSARQAVAELRNNGTLSIICTGRPVGYVRQHFGQYADGYICFNGRYGEINGETLYDCPLDPEQISSLTEKMDSIGLGYTFFNNHGSFAGGCQEGDYVKLDLNNETVYNFNIFFNNTDLFETAVREMNDTCIFNPHGPAPHADTTVLGSDKGTAIKAIVEKLNIPFENTYAFGDGANDVCMLKAVAHGVAMGNALPDTKAAAEFVTDTIDNDGLRKALQHYQLISD